MTSESPMSKSLSVPIVTEGAHSTCHDDVGERPASWDADFLDGVTARQQICEGLGVGQCCVGIVVQRDVGQLQVVAGVEREILGTVGNCVLDEGE